MPTWVAALLICLGFFALLLITNCVITFQAAMAGGGSPRRWYQLFFATHEILASALRRSIAARIAYLITGIAFLALLSHVRNVYGSGSFWVLGVAVVLLLSGIYVPSRLR